MISKYCFSFLKRCFRHNSGWYRISVRSRKLACLMIMRSRVPCVLTAGKYYSLNLANFSSVSIQFDWILNPLTGIDVIMRTSFYFSSVSKIFLYFVSVVFLGFFFIAELKYDGRIKRFKMADPIWWPKNSKTCINCRISMKQNSIIWNGRCNMATKLW